MPSFLSPVNMKIKVCCKHLKQGTFQVCKIKCLILKGGLLLVPWKWLPQASGARRLCFSFPRKIVNDCCKRLKNAFGKKWCSGVELNYPPAAPHIKGKWFTVTREETQANCQSLFWTLGKPLPTEQTFVIGKNCVFCKKLSFQWASASACWLAHHTI